METQSVTEVRAQLPAILRAISADPSVRVGITVNGRVEGVLSCPGEGVRDSGGWIATGRHYRDDLPSVAHDLIDSTNRGSASVWLHVATGALLVLVPTANWDEHGHLRLYYVSPSWSGRIPIEWPLGNGWDGSANINYYNAIDRAERYIADRLGGTA